MPDCCEGEPLYGMHHFTNKAVCCSGGSLPQLDTVVQVLDSLITSLTKHTSLLNPAVPQASVAFGADELSCMATETMFELANRCITAEIAPWLKTPSSPHGHIFFTGTAMAHVKRPVCWIKGLLR